MSDLEARRKEHDDLLRKWSSNYQDSINANAELEFTLDGPSDWAKYWHQHPRILFLLKESHDDGWNPSIPATMAADRFSENVTLWKYALNTLYQNPVRKMDFPDIRDIHNGDHSDIAFVETKKLNEGKPTSRNHEIKAYAKKDRAFLKAQIDLLDPNVVICAGTIDAYDAIYEEKYEPYMALSSPERICKCWQLSNRLVIDFVHPSYWVAQPEELYDRLCSLMTQGKVFEQFSWSKWFSRASSGNPPPVCP